MHKGVAARNGGHYARAARGSTFVEPRPTQLPTVEDAVRSYARAWRQARIRLADVPVALRELVRDA